VTENASRRSALNEYSPLASVVAVLPALPPSAMVSRAPPIGKTSLATISVTRPERPAVTGAGGFGPVGDSNVDPRSHAAAITTPQRHSRSRCIWHF
jgi:hypothetical protein